MKLAPTLFTLAAAAAATLFVAPVCATPGFPGHDGPPRSGGDPTPVPEPTDAVLLLMGVTGVVVGRKLHARAQRKG